MVDELKEGDRVKIVASEPPYYSNYYATQMIGKAGIVKYIDKFPPYIYAVSLLPEYDTTFYRRDQLAKEGGNMCEIVLRVPTKTVTSVKKSVKFPKYFTIDYSGDHLERTNYMKFEITPGGNILRTSMKYSYNTDSNEESWEVEKSTYNVENLGYSWGDLFSDKPDSNSKEIAEEEYMGHFNDFKEFLDHGV